MITVICNLYICSLYHPKSKQHSHCPMLRMSVICIYCWTGWTTYWQPTQFRWAGIYLWIRIQIDGSGLLTIGTATLVGVWFRPIPAAKVTVRNHWQYYSYDGFVLVIFLDSDQVIGTPGLYGELGSTYTATVCHRSFSQILLVLRQAVLNSIFPSSRSH